MRRAGGPSGIHYEEKAEQEDCGSLLRHHEKEFFRNLLVLLPEIRCIFPWKPPSAPAGVPQFD
jgi:hypothetical protein